MNLVLKDAVEVREKTKTTEERRRNIGTFSFLDPLLFFPVLTSSLFSRRDITKGRQRVYDSTSGRGVSLAHPVLST